MTANVQLPMSSLLGNVSYRLALNVMLYCLTDKDILLQTSQTFKSETAVLNPYY